MDCEIDYLTNKMQNNQLNVDLEIDIVKHMKMMSFDPEFDEAITMALEMLRKN